MAKKEIEAEIREVQESIKRGKIHLDESLRQIEGLQAQIQTIRQDIETGKKSGQAKRN
jgi:chromosome segregation ATPase